MSWAGVGWEIPTPAGLPQTCLNLPQLASDFTRFSVSISPEWSIAWHLRKSTCVVWAVSARRQAGACALLLRADP